MSRRVWLPVARRPSHPHRHDRSNSPPLRPQDPPAGGRPDVSSPPPPPKPQPQPPAPTMPRRAQRSSPPHWRHERSNSPPRPPRSRPPGRHDGQRWRQDPPPGGHPDVSSPPLPLPMPSEGYTTSATPPVSLPGLSSFIYDSRRPAPPTNPGPLPEEFLTDLLNRAVAQQKLDMSKKSEDTDKAVKETSSSSMPKAQASEESALNALEDLLDTTTLDESSSSSMPKPKGSEDTEQAVKKTLSSSMPQAQASEDTDQAVNLGTIKASSPSSHNSRPIYSLNPKRLNFGYFVRADIGGSFHTYPSLTGPFKSLKDVQKAINSLHAEQSKMMCMKGLSEMEMAIRGALYWQNGLRKNSAEAITFIKNLRPKTNMVRALLDKYNEDNNLSGDLVYELIKIVHSESIHERKGNLIRLYYHFNLIIRTKGADGRSNNLFFAEVACKEGKYEKFVLTFLRMLKPDDNGKCIECDVDMKHPSDVEYKRGRAKIHWPCLKPNEGDRAYMEELAAVYDEAQLKAQEARVRKEFKELYDQSNARFQKKYVVPAKRQENKGAASVRVTA